MEITTTELEGLIIIKPKAFKDKRGIFYESWSLENYKKLGIEDPFFQDNVSVSYKNVLRGLHMQNNQGQLIYVSHGVIFDVLVDLRENSKTYKKYFSIELNSNDGPKQIYMPPGFAHGFCVLSEFAIVNYKCTQYFDPAEEHGIIWNDPDINIKWPKEKSYIISEKDENYKPLGNYTYKGFNQ